MKRPRTQSGRWIVAMIVVLGVGMGLVGFLFRGARRLSLPLKPGSIVLVTCEMAAAKGGATPGDTGGAG